MKRVAWLVLVAGLTAVLAAPSWAAAREGGRKGERGGETQSELDLLVSECKLTQEQQTALAEKVKAKEAAVAAWNEANADKIKAAEDAASEARTSGDAEARKKAGAATRAIQTERAAAAAQADADILTVLTDDQKNVWAGYQLCQATLRRYQRLGLEEEQVAKVKAACAVAAKELTAVEGDDKDAKKERSAVDGKLRWAIEAIILTPDQRQAMEAASAGRTRGKAAETPETPAPETPEAPQ